MSSRNFHHYSLHLPEEVGIGSVDGKGSRQIFEVDNGVVRGTSPKIWGHHTSF